jgi:hypothetical protein
VLAYVFWHWPQPAVDRAEYERVLGRFHASLRDAPPPGFQRSWVWRVARAAWLPAPAYEDWYLLDDSAALDRLNDAAVTAGRQAAHEHAARLVAGGVAGLYRLRAGGPLSGARHAHWLAKPAGASYPVFIAAIRGAAGGAAYALWGRQMVLGPAPEFCVQVANPLPLRDYETTSLGLEGVWP